MTLPDYKGLPTTTGEPYLPSPELCDAVRVARKLGRPLLLKGEPGCGKTRLAKAVARELYPDTALSEVYFEWAVKSTSRARDGLYTFDSIGRLSELQLAVAQNKNLPQTAAFVHYGPLGRAFKAGRFAVVLIDEIDKADIDFPNDLLMELDTAKFEVAELDNLTIEADPRPLVIITSNDERDLPDAFLRRCVFHYVSFPESPELRKIVLAHFPGAAPDVLDAALARFQKLRDDMGDRKAAGGKKVGTSELIDWIRVLKSEPDPLAMLKGKLPFAGVLLKSWEDHQRFVAQEPKP